MTGPALDATLAEVLSHRARRTPVSRLGIDVAGGLALALTTMWARPPGTLILMSAGLCLSCYGAWAIAERRLYQTPWQLSVGVERGWRALRRLAGLLGLLALLLLLFGLFALGMGYWKS